jgi:hypothetical protein
MAREFSIWIGAAGSIDRIERLIRFAVRAPGVCVLPLDQGTNEMLHQALERQSVREGGSVAVEVLEHEIEAATLVARFPPLSIGDVHEVVVCEEPEPNSSTFTFSNNADVRTVTMRIWLPKHLEASFSLLRLDRLPPYEDELLRRYATLLPWRSTRLIRYEITNLASETSYGLHIEHEGD